MIAEVRRTIRRHALLAEGQELIVAVSGGVDSMVLLHVLHRLGMRCHVAHVEHGLRGDESLQDMRFVMDSAQALGLPCHVHHAPVKEHATRKGMSTQMAARELRHAWLRELSAELGVDAIAMAHHRDDALETLLLNMLRGTGAMGWRGIPRRSGPIVRPLLDLGREDILRWAREEDIRWREDASNRSPHYLRNRVRHELIPLLDDLRPGAAQAMARSMHVLDAITDAAMAHVDAILDAYPGHIPFSALAGPRGWLVLQKRLAGSGFHPDALQDMLEAVHNRNVGASFAAQGTQVTVDRDMLLIHPLQEQAGTVEWWIGRDESLPADAPVSMERAHAPDPLPPPSPHEAWLDPECIHFPLCLRSWRHGDRIAPHGLEGTRLVSDILVDAKVPLPDKGRVLLLCDAHGPLWVVGHRWATVPLAKPGSKNALHVLHRN